ncbi:ATP-binding protein, partial [Streptomyces sp. T-3]|nr:ATP-binding protein [Streptomyces sp. T-3]
MSTDAVTRAERDLRRERRLLVSGPPGIGKTTLLNALAQRAVARGERVLRLHPQPPDRAVPFAAVADLLLTLPPRSIDLLPLPQRRAVAAVLRHNTPPDGEPDPLAVRLALTAVLRDAAPCLILVDDAHCTDPASEAALTCLATLPVDVVGSAEQAPQFLDGSPTFTVEPLAADEVAALLAGQQLPARLAGRIHRA